MGRLVLVHRTLEPPDLAERAADEAAAAAARAGVEVRLLDSTKDFQEASGIFGSVWGTGPANAQMPAELIRALTHAGSYAAGAFRDGSMVGAVVGFLGRDRDGPHLHSHILGVDPGRQVRGTGFALKQHQRAWTLEQGMDRVTWTFDPLVRRNAYFNLHKLGADAASYYESFYGVMTDDVNAGDESDRLFVSWHLDGPKARDAASGVVSEIDVHQLLTEGAAVPLMATEKGEPRVEDDLGPVVLCATPDDIVDLRRSRPESARRWRHALRETLGAAMQDGYTVTGFSRSGWYVLSEDGRGGKT